jgi:hypothetical protein
MMQLSTLTRPAIYADYNRRLDQLQAAQIEVARLREMIANLKKENEILSLLLAEKETRQ